MNEVCYAGVWYDMNDVMAMLFELERRVKSLEHKLDNADIQYLP